MAEEIINESADVKAESLIATVKTGPTGAPGAPGEPGYVGDVEKKSEPITITQEALNALDAKAKSKGEQAIIKQLGLTKKDELPNLLKNLKSIADNEAKTEAEKPELERQAAEIVRLQEIEKDYHKTQAELQIFKEKQAILDTMIKMYGKDEKYKKGIEEYRDSPKKMKHLLSDIKELMADEEIEFNDALVKILTEEPPRSVPGQMAQGTGTAAIDKISKEDLKGLSYEERLKRKNPAMYAEYIKNKK